MRWPSSSSRAAAEEGGRPHARRRRDDACRRGGLFTAAALALGLLSLVGRAARAEEPAGTPASREEEPAGTPASREAIALCHEAQEAQEAAREALLEKSLARADAAIEADEHDALAHFARFCALGEQARLSGASLSSLMKLWAIRDAIDRTLELAPTFPDALLGKGALLSSVPRLLGGDPEEGERLVRRALEIDPDYVGARLFLAESYAERGRSAQARAEATLALDAARRKKDPEGIVDAQRALAGLARDDGS